MVFYMEKLRLDCMTSKTCSRRDKDLSIRVTEEEKAYLEQVAYSKGLTLSTLIVRVVEPPLNMEKLNLERMPYKTGPRRDKKLTIRITEAGKTYLEQVAYSRGITISHLVMSAIKSSLNLNRV